MRKSFFFLFGILRWKIFVSSLWWFSLDILCVVRPIPSARSTKKLLFNCLGTQSKYVEIIASKFVFLFKLMREFREHIGAVYEEIYLFSAAWVGGGMVFLKPKICLPVFFSYKHPKIVNWWQKSRGRKFSNYHKFGNEQEYYVQHFNRWHFVRNFLVFFA